MVPLFSFRFRHFDCTNFSQMLFSTTFMCTLTYMDNLLSGQHRGRWGRQSQQGRWLSPADDAHRLLPFVAIVGGAHHRGAAGEEMRIHRWTPSSLYGRIFPVCVQFIPLLDSVSVSTKPNMSVRNSAMFSGHVCLISPHWTRLDFSVYKPSCQLLRHR